jgi:hypothetical protein
MIRLVLLILIGVLLAGCISVKQYAQAEENLCDCLSGILAPADEFCVEWNREVAHAWEKLEQKMKRIQASNPHKALEMQAEIDSVKVKREDCMEAVSN